MFVSYFGAALGAVVYLGEPGRNACFAEFVLAVECA